MDVKCERNGPGRDLGRDQRDRSILPRHVETISSLYDEHLPLISHAITTTILNQEPLRPSPGMQCKH